MSTIPQSTLLRQELVKGREHEGPRDAVDTAVPSPSDKPRDEPGGDRRSPKSDGGD
ncbi:MAG TPA: hypothetical protein VEA15_11945 [Caulobacteraceae bacterium]|nr:hypothetical protein [Caulobacteraceae bacterium]